MSRYSFRNPLSEETRAKIAAAKRGRFKGADNPNWKGGAVIVSGYRYIYSPDHPNRTKSGYVAEHRLVLETKLGRLLETCEAVHHVDEDTLNNHPENLVLCASNGQHTMEYHAVRNEKGRFACA